MACKRVAVRGTTRTRVLRAQDRERSGTGVQSSLSSIFASTFEFLHPYTPDHLALKSNQKRVYEEVKRYFEDKEFLERIEEVHGQVEKREYYQAEDIGWNEDKEKWKGLKTIEMVRTTINGDKKQERYYTNSLGCEKGGFGRAVRGQ